MKTGLKSGMMALALFVGACSDQPASVSDQAASQAAASPVLAASVIQALDQRLDGHMQVYAPVGFSVAILRGDQLVYERHSGVERLGGATATSSDTLYSLFSMSKLFFLIEVFRSVERGELDLDAAVGTYVADLPEAWRSLTIRQLLSHVSGLPDYYSHPDVPPTVEAAFERVRDLDFISETGSQSRYNQTNFLLVKLALEEVSGRSYFDLVSNDQFGPLGLEHMRYGGQSLAEAGEIALYRPDRATGELAAEIYPTYPSYVWSSVGLNSTLSDLEIWAAALVRGDLVARQTLLDHWHALPLTDGTPGQYANGWEHEDFGDFIRVGHGGGGRVNFMHAFRETDPSDNVTVIYLDNGGPGEVSTRRLSAVLANEIYPGLALPGQILFDDMLLAFPSQGWPAVLQQLDAYIAAQALSPEEAEDLVNNAGYALFGTFGPQAALEAFRLNVARYPQSSNPHDSLAETLLAMGDVAGALEHYQHALALDPENDRVAATVGGLQQRLSEGGVSE